MDDVPSGSLGERNREWQARLSASSHGLNTLLLQVLVLFSGVSPSAFWGRYEPSFLLAWALFSLAFAGALGWALARWSTAVERRTWSVGILLAASALMALLSSAEPSQQWALFGSFRLGHFPLSGLETKGLAIVSALAAGRLLDGGRTREHLGVGDPIAKKNGPWLLPASLVFLMVASMLLLPMLPANLRAPVVRSDRQGVAQRLTALFPTQGYELPIRYKQLGPALVDAGAVNPNRLAEYFADRGNPLSEELRHVLTEGSQRQIQINASNAHFFLDLLWAFGLTNQNPILTQGPMSERAGGEISRYASTGGWKLGTKSGAELYGSRALVTLNPAQQGRVEAVAAAMYRPCCNNPTDFPDCNHGMAMLGLLELMAAQDASEAEMWQAAKYVNAFWFPTQMGEVALVFQVVKGLSFDQIDGEKALGPAVFSASGFRNVHTWLQTKGLLGGESGLGSSCGV